LQEECGAGGTLDALRSPPLRMPNADENAATRIRPDPRAWLPFAFVMASLVLLLAGPFIASRRLAHIRATVVDVVNDARVVAGEFEGAFAEELVIASASREPLFANDSTRQHLIERERASLQTLNGLVDRLGGKSIGLYATLRGAEAEWRVLNPAATPEVLSDAARDRRAIVGLAVIDAAEGLHDHLITESNRGRDAVRRLEYIDTLLQVGLASVALLAMTIVVTLERKVRAFAAEADDRARRLERAVEVRAMLVNGVIHDVKNPLGAASGFADLLEEGVAGPLNEQQAEMVGRFKRLIGTALQTVGEFVDLARVDAGEYTIERRATNLVAAIRRIVDDHQAQASRRSITLSFKSRADAIWLDTDAVRLRHVVENLLSNALKYTPSGGTVTVSVASEAGDRPHATILVRDTGPGIPPDLRERIFDPYYRVASTEQRIQGSGLGLAISRRIANLLGGTLTVTDAPGGGSDFVLTLPREEGIEVDANV
jgi:signal transduction histidine kinase